MLPTVATTSGGSPAAGGLTMPGNTTTICIWSPSARARNAIADSNASWNRSADTCFIRGLKETVQLRNVSNNTGGNYSNAWQWRRIVFTVKGLWQQHSGTVDSLFTSNGYVRFLSNFNGTVIGNAVTSTLFKGVFGSDWSNVMTAPADKTRVNILYDKTRQLVPQSEAKRIWQYKLWHPVNKNLVYNNEENGGAGETVSVRSTLSKQGCGDIYVVDFFECVTQDAADTLLFNPEATFYWHEK